MVDNGGINNINNDNNNNRNYKFRIDSGVQIWFNSDLA